MSKDGGIPRGTPARSLNPNVSMKTMGISTKGKMDIGREATQKIPGHGSKMQVGEDVVGRAFAVEHGKGGRPVSSAGRTGRAIEHDPTKR